MCKGSGGIGLHLASIRKQSVSAVGANKIAAVVSCGLLLFFFSSCVFQLPLLFVAHPRDIVG